MKTVPDAVNTIEMYAFVIFWKCVCTGKLLECMTVICAIHQVKFSFLSAWHSLPPYAWVEPCFYLWPMNK